MADLRIVGGDKLALLAAALRSYGEAGKGLQRELRKGIRKSAKPALDDAKRAVRAIPVTATRASHGGGYRQRQQHRSLKRRRGLRGRIAGAMTVQIKDGAKTAGVRLWVNPRALPPDQQTLPRRLDSTEGWRHPVFGNRRVWIHQTGAPYWYVTLRRHESRVRRDVLDVMDDVAKKIGGL